MLTIPLLKFGARSYKPVERMLKHGLDQRPLPDEEQPAAAVVEHENIRGPEYFMN